MTMIRENPNTAAEDALARLPPEPNELTIRSIPQERAGVEDVVPDPLLVQLSAAVRSNFLIVVFLILPMLIGSVYYFVILADQYVSETRFVLRSSANRGVGGLSLMVQSQGLTRADDDTYLVNEFLKSRDAVTLLAQKDKLVAALSVPSADVFYGFPTFLSGNTTEDLYAHYNTFIDVAYKASTGITTLQVRAFTPHDAHRLSQALLKHAEEVVNRLNKRARQDAIMFAQDVASTAERRVVEAQNKIAEFRNRELVMDPGRQSVVTLELVNKLFSERLTLETSLTEALTSTPDSPRIPAIKNRMAAIDKQIETLRSTLAGTRESMASKLSEFERLTLERELAAKALTAALSSLENARQDAERQQLYLERVVEPHIADKSQYPKRFQSMAMLFAICLALYWIVRSLYGVVMEHDT